MFLFFIISLALLLRIYHHHHILMSDEANNMLTIKAIIEGDGLREYFFKHPPLFTVLTSAASYPFGDNLHIVQGLSILFSSAAFFPLYLITEKVFDRRTALLSLLFLAVMPLNIAYSAWVKQDAMLLFFFIWSLYLYITERPVKSGIMFGIASLTKAFAWFLIPIVVGYEILHGWKGKESAKRLFIWLLIGFSVSWWWYAFFGRSSFGAISAVAHGGNLFEFSWHYPWYYYIRNMRADLLSVVLAFFLVGVLGTSLRKRNSTLFPLLWILAFYVPLSLMKTKAPWYTFLASPPIAVIAAVGFLKVFDSTKAHWMRWGVVSFVAMLITFNLYSFNANRYYEWLVARKLPVYHEEEYLTAGREILKGEGRVALLGYNPTLQYYLGISDMRLFYLGSQFPAMDKERVEKLTREDNIACFVIDKNSSYFFDRNVADLTYLYGEPKRVGNVLVFKVAKGNIP